jgi:hypothetical protein
MNLSPEGLAYFANRGAIVFRWLVWLKVKNKETGLVEEAGFWSGGDDRAFEIDGVSRADIGIGDLLKIPSITHQPGPVVRMQSIELKGISPQLENVLLKYDARLAPVELHLAVFDPETMNLVSIEDAGKGELDTAPAKFGGIRGAAGIRATMASLSRQMTRYLSNKKSNAMQSQIILQDGRPDAFRKYGAVSGAVEVWWGEVKRKPVEPVTTVTTTASTVEEGDGGA